MTKLIEGYRTIVLMLSSIVLGVVVEAIAGRLL